MENDEKTVEVAENAATTEEKSQTNENFRYRLERAKKQGAEQILNELGVGSVDEIKKKLEKTTSDYEKARKEADENKSATQKLEVLKNGFDEEFVDFIVYSLRETEDFSKSLAKFKTEHPKFLKNQNSGIKISTAANFEKNSTSTDFSKQFGETLLNQLRKN